MWLEFRLKWAWSLAIALVEIIGDIAAAHITGGDAKKQGDLAREAQGFKADEKESRGLGLAEAGNLQRAAQRSAKVVHLNSGLGKREGIVGVERGIFKILKGSAVVAVGSGFGDGGDVGHAVEFGIIVGL